jgi:hypothetical protein
MHVQTNTWLVDEAMRGSGNGRNSAKNVNYAGNEGNINTSNIGGARFEVDKFARMRSKIDDMAASNRRQRDFAAERDTEYAAAGAINRLINTDCNALMYYANCAVCEAC